MSILSLSAGMALTFGALHALEPGHGKTAIVAYMASGEKSWKDGFVLSVSSSVTHSISILIIAFISHYFFHHISVENSVANTNGILKIVSGLLIGSIGIWCLMTSKKKSPKTACCSCSSHSHHNHNKSSNLLASSMLGMAAGLIPCPTILIAYLAGVSSGNSLAGIEGVLLFAIGMCFSLLLLVTLCRIFGENIITRIQGEKVGLNWRLCQGILFLLIGFATAVYH